MTNAEWTMYGDACASHDLEAGREALHYTKAPTFHGTVVWTAEKGWHDDGEKVNREGENDEA